MTWRSLVVAVTLVGAVLTTPVLTVKPQSAGASPTTGYWLVASDGGVFAFGRAAFRGSTGGIPLNQPIVGMAATPTGAGYWMVAADGGIFAFGDAPYLGSMAGQPLSGPVVAMAATPTGKGYWLVAADGGTFAFGDAPFLGTVRPGESRKPIVDITATPSGQGYWLAASDGLVFAYGDAPALGSPAEDDLNMRIHAMAATPSGAGYWLVAGDGGVFAFGDAGYYGNATASARKRVLAIASSTSGKGYYVTTSNGQVIALGDATHLGGLDEHSLNQRVAAIVTTNANHPPVAGTDTLALDEDAVGRVDVLANDRDPEGGRLAIEAVGAPRHGSARVAAGRVLYEPAADYHGNDTFTYRLADDRNEVVSGEVSVKVRPVDDEPVAVDDVVKAAEDAAAKLDVTRNDRGLGDGIKSITIVDRPEEGTAEVSPAGVLTYTADTGFAGDDYFRYRVVDSDGDDSEAVVDVSVLARNDVPRAVDDGPFSVEGGGDVWLDVLANDDEGDGDLEIRLVDPQAGTPLEDNEATMDTGRMRRDGRGIRFWPAAGFTGTTAVRYAVVDQGGEGDASNVASATVDVVNGPPITHDQSVDVEVGQTVDGRLRADDPEGDPLTFKVTEGSGPSRFRVALDASTGYFEFGPVNEPGTYEFTYVASDGKAESERSRVKVHVKRPADAAPEAQPKDGRRPPEPGRQSGEERRSSGRG